MNRPAIRMKDIAQALNLSISTVSKAMKDSHEVSDATKEMVFKYARSVNYVPNPLAQALRKGRSRIIAIILPAINNDFFSQVIDGIESVAFEKGYNVLITQTHESYEREVLNVQNHFSRSVDGLLVSVSSETKNLDHFKQVQEKGMPIVFFDRVPEEIDTVKVVSNNYSGAYKATVHLIQQGFQRIAHITSSDLLSITKERLNGYIQALLDDKLEVDDRYIKYCNYGGMIREETFNAVNDLMNLREPPDAILTASDRLSIATYGLLKKMHFKIPEKVAMVGFTNSVAASILQPSLSAVMQPAFEMGQVAAESLIKIIESKKRTLSFENKILDTQLVIMNSSKRKQQRKERPSLEHQF